MSDDNSDQNQAEDGQIENILEILNRQGKHAELGVILAIRELTAQLAVVADLFRRSRGDQR